MMPRHSKLIALFLCILAPIIASTSEVPNTMLQAFSALDKQLGPQKREAFKNTPEAEAVANADMSLGIYMRNVWFRSGHSRLADKLHALGAQSFDDASAVVLASYWRHLNGRPLEIEKQCACYAKWWQEQDQLIAAAKAKGKDSYPIPSFSCP